MKKYQRFATVILAAAVAGMALAGCNTQTGSNQEGTEGGSSMEIGSTDAEPSTIKILHNGPEPKGWDAVYEEYLKRTKDTLNIELDINWVENAEYKEKLNLEITSGGEWDLVFDAPWIHLKTLAAEDYYADLSEYFNNPEYPGLKKAFTEEVMMANSWFGKMCYIPLFETYGNGIPCVWYRADWAREWGIGTEGQISSYEELEQYWQKALENGLIALGATQTRGFFQLMSIRSSDFEGSAEAGIQSYNVGGLNYYVYSKDGKLIDIAVAGLGDEEFADFPQGWNHDFSITRYETFAKWQEAGYIDPDSLSCTDFRPAFEAGSSASVIGTLDDYNQVMSYADTWGTGDEGVGFFVYVDSIRDMEEGAIPTNRVGNNGWAVPASSTKVDKTMKFLDWMFSSQENHDLIQLGIEGVDFEYGEEEGTYNLLSDYSSKLGGYSFSWNPEYALISTQFKDKALEYREYELSPETFRSYDILGFSVDTSDPELSTAVAQCKAVTDMVTTVKAHGIKTDGYGNTYDTMTEMLRANTEEAMKNGGQVIYDALKEQLEAYLSQQ